MLCVHIFKFQKHSKPTHTVEGQSSSHLEEGPGDSGGAGKIPLLDLSAGYMGVLS